MLLCEFGGSSLCLLLKDLGSKCGYCCSDVQAFCVTWELRWKKMGERGREGQREGGGGKKRLWSSQVSQEEAWVWGRVAYRVDLLLAFLKFLPVLVLLPSAGGLGLLLQSRFTLLCLLACLLVCYSVCVPSSLPLSRFNQSKPETSLFTIPIMIFKNPPHLESELPDDILVKASRIAILLVQLRI